MREDHDWPGREGEPPEPDPYEATQQAFSAYPRSNPEDDEELANELFHYRQISYPATPSKKVRRGLGRVFMIVGGVFAVCALLYLADLVTSLGEVPRGVTVAGVDVGGMNRDDAEAKLREEIEPRLVDPIPIKAGDVSTTIDPVDAGLLLDWSATLQQAGNQSLDPISRIMSFFTTTEVGIVAASDDDELRDAVTRLAREEINHPVTEGNIAFRARDAEAGTVEAYAIEPRQGQKITDLRRAMNLVKQDWLGSTDIELPVRVTPAKATAEGVRSVLKRTVNPMVSAPVQVRGDRVSATLRPVDIADSLSFEPAEDGQLHVLIDRNVLQQELRPTLDDSERPAKDARIHFVNGQPRIEPSTPGRQIDWEGTFEPLVEAATSKDERELTVVYHRREPLMSTQDARALGVKEVIGEFTTGGMASGAARNVAVMAGAVNGTIVSPGETFSLAEHTGARTASQGYIEAPVNEDGTGRRVIGGGVNQFTSTLYNAAYLAGLDDAGHTPHEHHFDRYPPARDAISVREDGSSVDLAFRNNLPRGVAIQAEASGGTISVRIWGTKNFRVESSTGERTAYRQPPVQRAGRGCQQTAGTPGFTVTDTRTRYNLGNGKVVDRQTVTATYAPRPRVTCLPPKPPPPRRH